MMKKVDEAGNLIRFSILKVSALKGQKPLSVGLAGHIALLTGLTSSTITRTTADIL